MWAFVATFLARMPSLAGHPAGALGGEAQAGGPGLAPGEDAVTGTQLRVQGAVRDSTGPGVEHPGITDGIHAKGAQRPFSVVPRIQVPVVAIVDQALGRDLPPGVLVPQAVVVGDVQALPFQHRVGDDGKMLGLPRAGRLGKHAHPARDFLVGVVMLFQQRPDTLLQRAHVGSKPIGLQVLQQGVKSQKRVDFRAVEPQTGQLVTGRVGIGVDEAVAAPLPVVGNRRVQALPHVFQVAAEGGIGHAQHLLEPACGHDAVRVQQLVYFVKTLRAVHAHLPIFARPGPSGLFADSPAAEYGL